ncbi:MAG TPA: SPFH domain-containing protein, partial [Candidatus Paceibacterota bacterium]|nr:SPFH domain-containing protein [Candidatus Paceibacterota bacterium]
MHRLRLAIGVVLAIGIFVGWNYFNPGYDQYDVSRVGKTLVQSASPYHMPFPYLVGMIGLAYILSWLQVVDQWNRRPIMLFGRYYKTLRPGISLVEPLMFRPLQDVPVQDVVKKVKAPQVQTKDNVGIGLTGLLTFRIDETRIEAAVVEVEDVMDALIQRALSTLTDTAGITELDGFLEHRDRFCQAIKEVLQKRVEKWGVTVQAFELQGFTIND